MPIITQGKTNWKFLVIVIVLAVIVSGVALFWQYHWIQSGQLNVLKVPAEKYCEKDKDCACGVNKTTRNCFYGNKNYVDTDQQCPDFCTGIGGNFQIKCKNNECKQISTIKDETADWKTYRDNEEKIEIKYPSKWQELDYSTAQEKGLFFAGFSIDGTKTNMENDEMKEKWAMVEITKVNRNPNQDIKDIFKDTPPEDKPSNSEIMTIDGVESIKAFGIRFYDTVVFIPKENYYYQVSLITTDKGFSFPIFNQILSTFKFIDEFCGTSTNGSCISDSDCIAGGCSGQLCQSKNDELLGTTCEWKECYRAIDYGVECSCVDKKCQWAK